MKEEKLYDGKKVLATAILPQNEDTGFFLVRSFDIRERDYTGGSEPLMVRAVTLELTNGETLRLVVGREKPTIIGGIEWAVAKTLKRMLDEKLAARVDESGVRYILYKDLADAFNTEHADEETGAPNDLKAKTVGMLCRDAFNLPVHRTSVGGAIFLEESKLAALFERFELDKE